MSRVVIGYLDGHTLRANRNMTREERFWTKVAKGDGCWKWTGDRIPRGYGTMGSGPRGHVRHEYAHRLSWEFNRGLIPVGLEVCHSCDNPSCVNPAHLFLGTHAENMADMRVKGRGHGPAKLTVSDVAEIRTSNAPNSQLAGRFGVTPRTVRRVRLGSTWKVAS